MQVANMMIFYDFMCIQKPAQSNSNARHKNRKWKKLKQTSSPTGIWGKCPRRNCPGEFSAGIIICGNYYGVIFQEGFSGGCRGKLSGIWLTHTQTHNPATW